MKGWMLSLMAPTLLATAGEGAAERQRMVLAVENLAATAGPESVRRIDPSVLRALRAVPRHLFVPEAVRARAYENVALPIGLDQTISQPYIVALMTHLLGARPGDKVLEVGTGSGYQAAVLAGLVSSVFSIEIVEPLAAESAERLRTLGYANVTVRAGDGYAGWPEQAPFDRVIVTAGADHIPKLLVEQLRPRGRMVIPVGSTPETLQLTLVRKSLKGRVSKQAIIPVRFVPLVRAEKPTAR